MMISAINPTAAYFPPTAQEPTQVPEEHILPPVEETGIVPDNAENDGITIAEEGTGDNESSAKAKGVLRKLQEGHFKGVADVRLRINFYEQIAAMDAEKAAQVASEGVSGLAEALNGEIDAYVQTLDGEQGAGISEAQNSMSAELAAIANESGLSTSELASRLQAAFDGFVAAIQPADEMPEEGEATAPIEETVSEAVESLSTAEDGIETIVDAEMPDTETRMSLDEFISGLIASFGDKLAALERALDTVSVLPPLSEPSGNGVAYQKFVTIYNDMRGVVRPEATPPVVDQTV